MKTYHIKMVSLGIFFIFPFSAVKSFSVVLHLVTLKNDCVFVTTEKRERKKKNPKQMRNVLDFIRHWFVCFEPGQFCERQALSH